MGAGTASGERAAGSEAEVARALNRLPDGWVAFHDVPWPGRAGLTIDHVVVGPAGVFVVESESWTGSVEVRDGVLTHDGRSREQAVDLAARAAIALQPHVPRRCFPVVCFPAGVMSGWARDVLVCSSAAVVLKLMSLPQRLGPVEVDQCVAALEARMGRRPAGDRPRDRAPRGGGRWNPVRAAIGALSLFLVFLVALASGALEQAATWVSDGYVNVQDEPVTRPVKHDRDGDRQGQGAGQGPRR